MTQLTFDIAFLHLPHTLADLAWRVVNYLREYREKVISQKEVSISAI